jgi:rhodanese-related sulfurtransferase
MISEYPTKEYLESQKDFPTIDIRTEGEWYQTGILENSHTLTFFDEMGQYNIEDFLEKLHNIIGDKSNKFLLICRTGSRTGQIAHYLSQQGYNVVNLAGGITYVMMENSFPVVEYKRG